LLLVLLASGTVPKRVESRPPDTPTTEQETPRKTSGEVARVDINLIEAQRIYVDRDATTGENNGDSWADAYTDLQDALDTAAYGDEIWVAEGVYTPTAGVTRTATFTLVNGVALYGGFAGTETAREERDWEVHVTVFSGDLDGNDIADANGVVTNTNNITGSNAYRIVTGGGVTETAVLDGFAITAGGNGLYNSNSSPTLVNVAFIGNRASFGGGMYNDNSNPKLTNVVFNDNKGLAGGGGMYCQKESAPVLNDVTFSGNTAGLGGAMYNDNSKLTLINVMVSDNRSNLIGTGGGMYNASSTLTLTNVVFNGNRASTVGGGHGGGIHNDNGSSLVLTNVTFSDNRTNSDGSGGGMYNNASDARLTNCILWGNRVGSSENEVAQITNENGAITVTHSLIQNVMVYTGTGNIDLDPQFVDPEADDLRLSASSPAIDAGDNDAVTVAFDLDGNSRRVDMPAVADTGNGAAPIVDMGAYETSPPPPVVSLDGPTMGAPNTPYTFTATIVPSTTITPITYSWQATGQLPMTHTGELNDTIAFTWTMTGEQLVTVTATNVYNVVTATHAITISHRVYLPLVMRKL